MSNSSYASHQLSTAPLKTNSLNIKNWLVHWGQRFGASIWGRLQRRILTRSIVFFWKILFSLFPEQHLTIEQHVNLGRHFGPLESHPYLKNPFAQHPELFELAANQGGIADGMA